MKYLLLLLLLGTLAIPAAAFSLPQLTSSLSAAPPVDLPLVATFEGGQRYQAGDYPVIVLSGSYREMGRQYGGLMKTELNEEYTFLMDTLTRRGYSKEELRDGGRIVVAKYPQRVKEIFTGMSETSGLSPEDVAIVYYGPIFLLTATPVSTSASCSYLATWGNYTTDGSMAVSRNWDLDDVVMPLTKWYVLAVYRPTDGSNAIATWSPAGARPETFLNDKGLFIADDNAGFVEIASETRPEFITEYYRFMFDYSDLASLDAGLVERVNIVEFAGDGGGHLEQEEKLADTVSIDFRQRDRQVHAVRVAEGERRADALAFEQAVERLAAQIRDAFDFLVDLRD